MPKTYTFVGELISVNGKPTRPDVPVRRFVTIMHDSGFKGEKLDVTERDRQGNWIHFPLQVGSVTLNDMDELTLYVRDQFGMNDELTQLDWDLVGKKFWHEIPADLDVVHNEDRDLFQELFVVSANRANMPAWDVIDLVDEDGKLVELTWWNDEKKGEEKIPVKWIQVFDGTTWIPATLPFDLWLSERFPAYFPMPTSRANFAINLLTIDGERKQYCYRQTWGSDTPLSPRELVLRVEYLWHFSFLR